MQDTGWGYICCLFVSQASHADCTWDGTWFFFTPTAFFLLALPSLSYSGQTPTSSLVFPPLDLLHSQQQGVWILCPKYILESTAFSSSPLADCLHCSPDQHHFLSGPLQQPHNSPHLSSCIPAWPLHSCKNNHNYFTFPLNRFQPVPWLPTLACMILSLPSSPISFHAISPLTVL